mgnify:FL=1
MNHVDVKYVGLLSSRLHHFKKKTNNLYNFRCPLCGDSEKNRYKARGYLYPSKDRGSFVFKCHNCGDTRSFGNLIKHIDNMLYKNYMLEGFGNKSHHEDRISSPKTKKRRGRDITFLENLGAERIDRIPKNHVVHRFINDRQIPDETLSRLYYVHDDKVLEKVDPRYRDRIRGNQPRVVLPFINRDKELVGIAARAINSSTQMRYLAFRLNENAPMIFGLDRIKRNSRDSIYVVEGPIDSLFLNNAIAVGGSDFSKLASEVRKDKCVIVFDNEPRNREIVKKMKHIIDEGYRICIWSESIKQKDINDMILAEIPASDIEELINRNTYSGLQAMTAFNAWKRVGI